MLQEVNGAPGAASIVPEDEEVFPVKYTVTSYGADYPVDGLVKRLQNGDIYVPVFQRGFVWDIKAASRFIESLLLGLPVPGIFLTREESTQKLLVIDGQQRLSSLQFFYEGKWKPSGAVFALAGVQPQWEGRTYHTLEEEDRRRLDDTIIHTTVVRQDEPSDDESSIYLVFERLNTQGMTLLPQEIRASLYHGPFRDLLKELNEDQAWRQIFGPVDKRMRDQELILRFLALYFETQNYQPPMKEFLNKFMARNKDLKIRRADILRHEFLEAVGAVQQCLPTRPFRPQARLNAAVFDSFMVATARRLRRGQITNCDEYRQRYEDLIRSAVFMDNCEFGTARKEKVQNRLAMATEALQTVP